MALDLQKMQDQMEEFFNSEKGQLYLAEQARARETYYNRLGMLENHLETLSDEDFSKFIDKLISKHDEAYKDRMYSRGVMPHLNHVMGFLFDLAFERAEKQVEPIDEFAKSFPSETAEYRGYYFGHIHGQGTVSRIHSPNKELIFQL